MEIPLIFYLTGVSVVLTFAIVSNVLVIICVVKYRHLRSVTNVLISSLAACDVVLSGAFLPQKLHDVSHPENYHEGKLSRLNPYSLYVIIFVINIIIIGGGGDDGGGGSGI
ncbi:hypothetical protein DPMN_034561 [Dreissena polymorpha]|uniref:G-protein coupled receptors family 1 profile domain-containing protein n=1 Tax=Dreissena polymorpha TaxID=45954 RepID=A0A9D4M9A6_DREPO|nr:hypothetical protein DPMN_034561 [Dreissena polymorpha]